MIVNMALKRIADFHGHVCPDLVLGSKFCEYIQKLLPSNKFANGIAAIISENCTSALDAIQILLGATLGNQRLKVMDFGKHNYTVIPKSASSGFRLILNIQTFEDENEYQRLSCKMLEKTILMDEVVQLQTLLDERVKYLLKQSPESIFRIEWTQKGQPAKRLFNLLSLRRTGASQPCRLLQKRDVLRPLLPAIENRLPVPLPAMKNIVFQN